MTKRKRLQTTIFALLACAAPAIAQQTIVPSDPRGNPESLSVGPDGTVYLGSATAPVVYRARKGAATADLFIDLRPGGGSTAFTLGILADAPSNTLWVCEVLTMDRSFPILRPTTVLRAFDLATGVAKGRYPLAGSVNLCNDMTIAPDRSLYVADTINSQILRLAPGSETLEVVLQNSSLFGIDGITFLNGVLYVNTIWSNGLWRIPIDASGKAGPPVYIYPSEPLAAPDGMRAAGNRLIVGNGGNGKVQALTIEGDRATVTTLASGLAAPDRGPAVRRHGVGRRARRQQGDAGSVTQVNERHDLIRRPCRTT